MSEFSTRLRELEAPEGWTACLLEASYPLPPDQADAYRAAVEALLERVPAFLSPEGVELLLLFEYLRPRVEIPAFQDNTRLWEPEFGMGVWLDREPQTLWTKEEFRSSTFESLRPMVDRVVRIARSREAQSSCWRRMLGSGAVICVRSTAGDQWVEQSTELFQPFMVERAFRSFPFYVPLVTAKALAGQTSSYPGALGDLLPSIEGYGCESQADGGFLLVMQQPRLEFWDTVLRSPLPFAVPYIEGLSHGERGDQ